jgi:integrase
VATIERYSTKTGTLWRVRYRTPDNRQTDRRGFTTKRDAEAFAATVEFSKLRGEYVAPSRARVTVGELGPDWLARQQGHLKPSSYRPLEATWRLRVQPRWGAVSLGDIRPSAVQSWITDLGRDTDGRKGLGASVVQRSHQVLAAILADAVRDRMIATNPAAGTKLPRKTRKRPVYLTHRQVAALAEASGPHGPLVLLLAYTGLRWGEATGLRVRDLDMLRKRATVSENAVWVGSEVFVGTPKTHKARAVPLPAFLLPELARQCEGKGREDLLFPGEDGGYLGRSHTGSGWFDKAVTRAKLPKVSPHDLRHTAASLAVSAGANVKAIQRMLGHASAAMTLDLYADLFDDDLDAVAARLDDARSRENVGTMWAQSAQSHL